MEMPQFKDRDWNRLLDEIEKREVVPLLGQELLICRSEEPRDLYSIIARALARNLELEYKPEFDQSPLHLVADAYARTGKDILDIYAEIPEIVKSLDLPIPEPMIKLASITQFDLYISTTFDSYLQMAIDRVRFNGNPCTTNVGYSIKSAIADLPKSTDLSHPVVYQLFGKMESVRTYAVTEDDVLDFGHHLQSENQRPKNLFDMLGAKCLLMLGCSFPDWLARFLILSVKGASFWTSQDSCGLIADKCSIQRLELVQFLTRHKARIYPGNGVVEFVDELYKRWIERNGRLASSQSKTEKPDAFNDDMVFISYASEDRASAEQIRDALEEKNLGPWLDSYGLEPGDDYKRKILEKITRASLFIPVISANTLLPGRRFYKSEWAKAIEEMPFRSLPNEIYIIPIIIDNTSPNNPALPQEFSKLHCQRFENGAIPPAFINVVENKIKEIRRTKRVIA